MPLHPEPTEITHRSPSEPTGTMLPSYEKSRQEYDAPMPVNDPPTGPMKAYQGQPDPNYSQAGHSSQYPMHLSDVKAYPGQQLPPDPTQQQQFQPQAFYTPYGHPSGYATATPLHALQSAPCPVDCPACGCREMTRTEPVTGMTTHGWAAVLCFCCCLGCIPYLMSSLKDVDHFCGKCGAKLACWHNSGRIQVFQGGRIQAPPSGTQAPTNTQKESH
ncbi:LPS-induced tumor necrosis factor alpha factor [Penicillium macrosclerotiorum]|uniref:LPS-induced tumor necrosis factor alpha factor n=1 Tax=Penicillium macrosclerotiorum TaxID=303699 RepID=UPI0025475636|nr:LPS-induced tumor necrosis factor alpha factor [Penicillium macrosclerotiorum]KAJ5689963.1 LPS-induced tumor necrosis factor alpha factor [Penicillium macrosclerotiorum]